MYIPEGGRLVLVLGITRRQGYTLTRVVFVF